MSYQCPLCHQPLTLKDRSYRCDNNHQFDLAKEGYVNLMPANQKRSKNPGDNTEMMQARRRFLSAGHYQKMAERVAGLCREQMGSEQIDSEQSDSVAGTLLDIGCGEGYYTHQVEQKLTQKHPETKVYGLDISKVAVRYAAKRYPECDFSVASSHRLPFADGSLDAVLRIYAPCKAEELARCIKPGGAVITVAPASRHLYQLRERIYDGVRLHDESAETIPGFTLAHQEVLNYNMRLSGAEALDLLQMTPFAWKATDELRSELAKAKQFDCEADFMIRVYRKES
jgi:23S rRNA (guanine745-N1)-methyltransferase